MVQAWADEHGVTFSSALETLALLGLKEDPHLAMLPVVISAMRDEVQRQSHRISALLAAAAVESGVAARLAGAVVSDRFGREKYEAARTRARLQAVDSVRRREGLEELIGGGVREGAVQQDGGGDR